MQYLFKSHLLERILGMFYWNINFTPYKQRCRFQLGEISGVFSKAKVMYLYSLAFLGAVLLVLCSWILECHLEIRYMS